MGAGRDERLLRKEHITPETHLRAFFKFLFTYLHLSFRKEKERERERKKERKKERRKRERLEPSSVPPLGDGIAFLGSFRTL